MILVRFQGTPFNITVIQVYAQTTNAEEAEVEQFYEDLQDLLEVIPKNDVLFITGDWNAKVGSQEIPGVTDKFGLGVQNEGGHGLTEFCQENTLVIVNTLFQQYKSRLYTWTWPNGQYRNQTDSLQPKMEKLYIVRGEGNGNPLQCSCLENPRDGGAWWAAIYGVAQNRTRLKRLSSSSSIQSGKTRLGADCGSDHELLIAKSRLKLKKVGKTTRPFRYDLNLILYNWLYSGSDK